MPAVRAESKSADRGAYALVTAAYGGFTLTDGALRMLVLLHLYGLGYTALELAAVFAVYELVGVLTNGSGGWAGARFGLKATLLAGLALQIVGLGLLAVPEAWLSVGLLVAVQVLSGVAKDLTKMSSKSFVKLVVPEGDGGALLRWVSLLTGSKNALKGVGFFLGGLLLAGVGFRGAVLLLAGFLALVLIGSAARLSSAPGRRRGGVRWGELWTRDRRIRALSLARVFLFASRDVWFAVALPLYLSATLGWGHGATGAFLAAWVIGYGAVQASAPAFTVRRGELPGPGALLAWAALLLLPVGALAAAFAAGAPPVGWLVAGLAAFGVVFAANSAIHSFLIVAWAERGDVSLNVGFYYMANAMGRLVGTALSGLAYQFGGGGEGGLGAALALSLALVVVALAASTPLPALARRQA